MTAPTIRLLVVLAELAALCVVIVLLAFWTTRRKR
jgi:hypothetical protein